MDKESWLLAGVILFAGYGLARSLTACTPMVRPGQNLFLVGDSLAVGMTKHFRTLASSAGVNYSSKAQSGTRTPQWLQSSFGLQASLQAFKPNLVLVSLGTNDSKSSLSSAEHAAAIQKLITMIRSTGAEVMWILPPKLPWQQPFSDLVRAEGVPVFESSAIDIPQGPDGIHPTGAGYAGWAGMVWKSITCGDNQAEQLSGPPPAFVRKRPRTRTMHPIKASGVFSSRRKRPT